jgi:hypothetical protein
MKYLLLLGLLFGCGAKPKYPVGSCLRIWSLEDRYHLYVLDMTEKSYILSIARKVEGVVSYYPRNPFELPIKFIEEYGDIQKINCNEVE